MIRVRSVSPLDGYHLHVEFTDGTEREVDVESYLRGPVFEPVRWDRSVFESVAVDPDLGAVVWPNGADIDPDVLYGSFEPAWAEAGAGGGDLLPLRSGRSGRVAERRPTPAYGAASTTPQATGTGGAAAREFTAVIFRHSDGFYVGSVPAIPGCQARAGSRDDLTGLLREAIRHAIEAGGVPAGDLEFVGVQRVEALR